ncbi:hypothetical protein Gotri_021141 [Gossypium trilobum]|uniref:Uncharacterized protein n=1 Tax=Gossypium trilobum TaxID=34281 RepID=A0A7J9DC05_9ROSI|nr:hypothetical protein [Gossypium trilobum]
MATPLFDLLKNPVVSWIVVAPLLAFATFILLGSLSIVFTSTALILSTFLFVFCKRKPKLVEKSAKEEIQKLVHGTSSQMEHILASKQHHEALEGGSGSYQIHGYLLRSPDVLFEKESTTEDSGEEWPFRDSTDRTPDISDDGSISDEDSLIEISLPEGHYVSRKEEEPAKYIRHQKLTDSKPECIFQQRSLMELLAELNDMNEEDNLIEIDISMGSIKCSSFEIEAGI